MKQIIFVEKCKIVWIRSSLCILMNWIVSLWIPIRRFCRCVSEYSLIISSKRRISSNSMNFSRIFFSWIPFKKISDCLVFHQLVTQDSRLLLNEREIHQGKNTRDARYKRGVNAFFFCHFSFHLWIFNEPTSLVDSMRSNISLMHEFYYKVSNLWIYSLFLFVISQFFFESRKNTEID